ncbi:MAG: protein kinase, partial [Planctomycetaceae bacterium]|nr:protein kinase [Planctomycetaceae bacterium]
VTDETTLARFQRELDILKKLKHPNIVRCFGGECKNKRQYYAMELVEGGTLEEMLDQKGRLAWELVVEFGLQMCAALAFSHKHGVVHRDIKPGNFLITSSGRLKLGDFGLASVTAARRITAEGRTMGTYHYMAPEQIRGKEIVPQTDLYSLGCVFFELLSGQPPFEGETAAEILHQHIKTPAPRVGQFAPDCPAGLEQLVSDMLQKKVEERPPDADTVARRLKAVTQTIIVKQNLRPFEKNSSEPGQAELTETRSAPIIQQPPTETKAAPARGLLAATILGFGFLLMIIFSILASRSPNAEKAEELWIAALKDDNAAVQVSAAKALGELGKRSETATNVLIESLEKVPYEEQEKLYVKVAVIEAIGEAGYYAKSQIGPMQKLGKESPNQEIRTAALKAFEKLKDSESPGRSIWFYLNILTLLATVASVGWVFLTRPS